MNSHVTDQTSLKEFLQENAEKTQTILRGVDLRGTNLAGFHFDFLSMELSQLDGADLSHSQFNQVDITNATFRGANLDGASFRFVRGGAVNWSDIQAEDAQWDRSSLVESSFVSANLKRARFVNCGLEMASFNDADIMLGSLAWSNLDRATFRNTNLDQVETIGISLDDADLSTARSFAYCREIVLEILKRQTDRDLPTMKWLGAIMLLRKWCFPVWARLLKDEPQYYSKAVEIFRMYPASGCLEAFLNKKDADLPTVRHDQSGL
jgi:uncharacterized protein YjbI with pentapeptide repeats